MPISGVILKHCMKLKSKNDKEKQPIRLAAIDIGTNSTRLLISDINLSLNNNFPPKNLYREMHITRLGKNLGLDGVITINSAEKTIEVLKKYLDLMNSCNVNKFRAVGTRVLRDAKNSKWFTDMVNARLGMKIDVVSFEEEAKLSFLGAVRGLTCNNNLYKNNIKEPEGFKKSNDSETNVLVIDIGGGSTEFIAGNLDEEILYLKSIPIGSVTVSEQFLSAEKPEEGDLKNMYNFISFKINKIIDDIKKTDFKIVVGLAGTVSAVASVDLGLKKYDREKIHGYTLDFTKVMNIQDKFCSMGLEQRKRIAGLDRNRADIIIGGTAILLEIFKQLSLDRIFISENDILDGIIYSIF